MTLDGNLPSDAADGTALDRVVKVYDAAGAERNLTLTFTKAGSALERRPARRTAATANGTLT